MLQSKLSKACFYLESKVDVADLMGMRHKLKKTLGVKVTTNAFYIEALARAVEEFPLMVGRIEGDCIRIAQTVNVGFAVNAPHGLVVPVVKGAEGKSLAEIALEEALLTKKARSNKLTLEDIESETIALSNLGAYDIDSFIGIVPPPTSTILSVGNVIRTAVWRGGDISERKMVSLTLAVDRRVVDEIYAGRFLGFIKEQLQNPRRLV